MADEIPFTDPMESEAFPGLLFGLTTNRDSVTLGAYCPAHAHTFQLISLDRRGYLIRHPIPGSFSAMPPDASGTIPLAPTPRGERQRPTATEERPPTRHPCTGTHWRLRGNGIGGLSIQFLANSGAPDSWITTAQIDSYGQFVPNNLSPRAAANVRAHGLYLTPENAFNFTAEYDTRPPGAPRLASQDETEDEDDDADETDDESPDETETEDDDAENSRIELAGIEDAAATDRERTFEEALASIRAADAAVAVAPESGTLTMGARTNLSSYQEYFRAAGQQAANYYSGFIADPPPAPEPEPEPAPTPAQDGE